MNPDTLFQFSCSKPLLIGNQGSMGLRMNAGASIGGLLLFGTITSLFAKIGRELLGRGLTSPAVVLLAKGARI